MSLIQSNLPVKNYAESALRDSEPTNTAKKTPAWVKPTVYTALSVAGAASSFFILYQAGFFSSQNPAGSDSIADRTILPFRSSAPDSSASLPAPNLFCPIPNLTDFDQNGNALDKLNIDIQPGTGLNILGMIEKSETRQEGSSDFSTESRDISKGKNGSKDEKYKAKPTLHQSRFFNHEQYNLSSKINSQCFPIDPAVSVDLTKVNELASKDPDSILESFVQRFQSLAPDSLTSLPASNPLPNLFCPLPGLTDFNQYKNASASQTLISKVTDEMKNRGTSLARLGDQIDKNLVSNQVAQYLFPPPLVSEVWSILTTPIREYPWIAVLGAVLGLHQRIAHVYKQANVARLAMEQNYLSRTLRFFLSFTNLKNMPENIRKELALGMDNLDTKNGWNNYIEKIDQLIKNEGIPGFKRVWASVLNANPPKPPQDVLEFLNLGTPSKAFENVEDFINYHQRKAMLFNPNIKSTCDYYQYVNDVKSYLLDAEWFCDLEYKHTLTASIFTVNGIVNNIFSILLDAVFLPSVVLLVKRNINPMF